MLVVSGHIMLSMSRTVQTVEVVAEVVIMPVGNDGAILVHS